MSNYEYDIGENILIVTAQWIPDPKVLEAEMVKMANSFADWSVPMRKAKFIMIEATRRRFQQENDPYGVPWAELNEDYWHKKVEVQGYPDEILVRTDKMRTAAISPNAWFTTEREVFFNAEALPTTESGFRYGMAHQTGAKTGKGATLPQRMFIGADEEAALEIEAVFLDHLYNTVEREWEDPGYGDYGIVETPGPEWIVGATEYTTTGRTGIATGIPAGKTGGQYVRGALGLFIGRTYD